MKRLAKRSAALAFAIAMFLASRAENASAEKQGWLTQGYWYEYSWNCSYVDCYQGYSTCCLLV